MVSLDLCVTASRRPELLAITLQSFYEQVFCRFMPERVFVNLDPIFGSEADHSAVLSVVRERFPAAIIFEPEAPCFGAAVKRLWSATMADYVFHLEDDWVANCQINEDILFPFKDKRVQQVSFHTAEQKWDIRKKGHVHERKIHLRLMGVKLPFYISTPRFTTSPSILRGAFARSAASLMDPQCDPEKQFYASVNMALEEFVKPFRNYIFSPAEVPVIKDIGREWRDARGIEKTVKNAVSTWKKIDAERART